MLPVKVKQQKPTRDSDENSGGDGHSRGNDALTRDDDGLNHDISVSVNAANSPAIKRVNRQVYENKMPGKIQDHRARRNFSLTIYGLTLPQCIQRDLFPGLTEERADELELTEDQRNIEYLSFADALDKTTANHLNTILKVWEDRMPLIKDCDHAHFFDQGNLRFVIPDHLQWFDCNGELMAKSAEEIIKECASRSGARVTVRLTVGINAEENMINPHYVWGLSQILLT